MDTAVGTVGSLISLLQAIGERLDALEDIHNDAIEFRKIVGFYEEYLRNHGYSKEGYKPADGKGTSFDIAVQEAVKRLAAIGDLLNKLEKGKQNIFKRAWAGFNAVRDRDTLRELFNKFDRWIHFCNLPPPPAPPVAPSPNADAGQPPPDSRDGSTEASSQPSTPVSTLQRSAGFRSQSESRIGPGPGLGSKPVSGSIPRPWASTRATAAADTPVTSRASSASTASASIRVPDSSTLSRHPPARTTKSAVDLSTAGRSGGEPRLPLSGKAPSVAPALVPAPVPALELHCYGSMPKELPYVQPSTPRWSDLATALSLPLVAGSLSSAKTHLAVARQDGTVRLLDTSTLNPVDEWAAVGPLAASSSPLGMNLLSCVCWRGDGAQLAVGDGDGTIVLWDLSRRGGHPGASPSSQGSSLHVPLSCLDWNPVYSVLIAAGSNADATIRIVNTAHRGNAGLGVYQLAPQAQVGSVSTVHWHPQGLLLASGHDDGHVCIWDTSARQLRTGPFRHESNSGIWRRGAVTSVHWSPDGNRLASSGKDRVFRIWDWRSGQVLYTLPAQTDVILRVRWSPDGSRLACAAGSKIRVVAAGHSDAYRHEATLEGHGRQIVDISWQPDGQRLASGSVDDTVRIWRMTGQGQPEAVLTQGQCVYCVAWQPSS